MQSLGTAGMLPTFDEAAARLHRFGRHLVWGVKASIQCADVWDARSPGRATIEILKLAGKSWKI